MLIFPLLPSLAFFPGMGSSLSTRNFACQSPGEGVFYQSRIWLPRLILSSKHCGSNSLLTIYRLVFPKYAIAIANIYRVIQDIYIYNINYNYIFYSLLGFSLRKRVGWDCCLGRREFLGWDSLTSWPGRAGNSHIFPAICCVTIVIEI